MAASSVNLGEDVAWPRARPDALSGAVRIERLIAWIRFAVTIGVVVVVMVPPRASPYPMLAAGATTIALAYGVAGLLLVHRLGGGGRTIGPVGSRRFAVVDATLTLLLISVTGAGSSLLLGVTMLVTIEVAMRFSPRETLALVAFVGLGAAGVILLVPEPALAWPERTQAAMWWMGLLGWSAAMVAALARLLLEEQHQRSALEVEQDAERRELAREREQRCRLEALDRERKDFLQVLHHELRTPVASMEALSRAVVREEHSASRARMLDLIQAHAHNLTGLLEELRAAATSDEHGANRWKEQTDVSAAELISLAAHAAGMGEDDLEVEIEEALAILRIDAEKMRRVLINLLQNAKRHSPDGHPVGVGLHLAGGRIVISVRDEGPGVTSEDAERMFGKFVSFGERRGASGLGLWIVGELVRGMGGSIRVHNRSAGGLAVTVELPAADSVIASLEPAGTR